MFPIVLALHVAAAVTAVASGALSATAAKGPGRHPRAGTVYRYALAVVFVSVTIMAALRWDRDWHLFVIASVAFGLAAAGARPGAPGVPGVPGAPDAPDAHGAPDAPDAQDTRQETHGTRVRTLWHGAALSGSYVLLFTGFYVDNGPRLPLWDRLPHVAYWFIPAAIGAPLTWRALAPYRAWGSTTEPTVPPLLHR